MYAETDFLLALIKDEDWFGDAAETVYRDHRDDLWTSQFTLVELLMVAYREGLDTERVVTNAAALLEVRGDVDTVVAAATYVEDHGFTPFDALHLVESDGDTIVSSDEAYESFAPRLDLKQTGEGEAGTEGRMSSDGYLWRTVLHTERESSPASETDCSYGHRPRASCPSAILESATM